MERNPHEFSMTTEYLYQIIPWITYEDQFVALKTMLTKLGNPNSC